MKKLFLLFALCLCIFTQAQFSIRFVVNQVPTKANEDIYIMGSFNGWNPKDEAYKLRPFAGGKKIIVVKNLEPGNYAYKFTRGDMSKVESTADGRDIPDRVMEVNADFSYDINIAGWKDDYPEKPKRYSASPQVRIIDTAFAMPQLQRSRRIWIYLPKGYGSSSKTYPVLYMHDGQNLFNEQTAYAGEWGVDECLDTLQKKLGKEAIVVGIDNGGSHRMKEYNWYDHAQYGKGEGQAYLDFISQTLKPWIDSKYRTKKGPEYTAIAGSSMGGLISMQALMYRGNTFGTAGVFSPSFWIAPQIFSEASQQNLPEYARFYLYAGGRESNTLVDEVRKMGDVLNKKSNYDIRQAISPIGAHQEQYWRNFFPDFYTWWSARWPE